jgi:hypothetical protein
MQIRKLKRRHWNVTGESSVDTRFAPYASNGAVGIDDGQLDLGIDFKIG